MRRSSLFIALSLFVSLSFAGCGTSQTGSVAQKAQDTFTSIRDAIDRSMTLRCEYTDEDGQTTIAYIKGNQVRLDSAAPKDDKAPNFHGLIKDNKMWIWAEGEKQGMTIDFTKIQGDEMKMGETPIHSQDDVISKLEEEKDKCQTSTVADSQFTLPVDVTFQEAR